MNVKRPLSKLIHSGAVLEGERTKSTNEQELNELFTHTHSYEMMLVIACRRGWWMCSEVENSGSASNSCRNSSRNRRGV